jgi:hypothetical protein
VKHYITEVEANTFTILSPKENETPTVAQVPNQTVSQPQPIPPETPAPEENFSDDLPF